MVGVLNSYQIIHTQIKSNQNIVLIFSFFRGPIKKKILQNFLQKFIICLLILLNIFFPHLQTAKPL